MKVHHLSCGTLCPIGGRLLNRSPARVACHCLLIETERGLVLVDTGLGRSDLANPRRLGPIAPILRVRRDAACAAVEQVRRLGFSPGDVRHLIPTHLDLDHAGGIPDFPEAKVHVHRREHEAMRAPRNYVERERYRACHFEGNPRWVLHDDESGEPWFGFGAVRAIDPELPPEILLVPLPGHTRGHTGVAVQTEDGWLLHAGDAYYDYRQMDPAKPQCSPGFRLFQSIAHDDKVAARNNLTRLRALAAREFGVRVFCAHDPTEYERLSGESLA